MQKKIDSILFHVVYQGHQIVYRHGSGYFLNYCAKYVEIPNEIIEELLNLNYFAKTRYDGLMITENAKTYAETIVRKLRKPNPLHPGKFIDYCEFPEEYC